MVAAVIDSTPLHAHFRRESADTCVMRAAPSRHAARIASASTDLHEEPIRLVTYDPAWPRRFAEERALLEVALDPWLDGPIEHIGSTAVPGLTAKPVIDIMAGVRDLASSLDARDAVAPLGYLYFPYRPDVMHWFCKPSPARRTHHLHLVPANSPLWAERIAFRDCLRSSAVTAAGYAALKTALAARYRLDREAYTDAKGDFIRSVLEDARRCSSS
jgi:GrpB-like predicted nucleotidyltransferase (UPF0157 family)